MLTLCYPYEPMMGLEPMTSSLPRKCSTAELHRLLCLQSNPRQFTNLWVDGASILKHVMSGRRASNPQPIAWKAIALPIELLPLFYFALFLFEPARLSGPRNCDRQPDQSGYLCRSGGRRIRTFEAEATDLQSVPFDRSGIPPVFMEPPAGIEPATY